ncbi:hypothetical protein [Streptomyces sp. NPDC058424]|uniref:hypothetical protein n=1 Tax=Streptomyces sp. NPDC058424 TaxID=3346491 RepID=UPI0036563C3E
MAHIQQLHSAAGPDLTDAPRPDRRRLRRPVLTGIPVVLALAGVAVVTLSTAGGPAGPGEPAPVAAPVVIFAYLGSRGLQVAPGHDAKPGTVTERTAILQRAVVDKEKERPASPGRAS